MPQLRTGPGSSLIVSERQRRIVIAAAGVALLIGAALLVSWLAGGEASRFAAWRGKTNAAVATVLAALALLAVQVGNRRLLWASRALAAASAVIGAVTLIQYLVGLDFGIDQLLAQDPWYPESARHPNRMAPNAALAFAFGGLALMLATSARSATVLVAQGLALSVLVLSGVALVGYVYDASLLYRPTTFIRISPYIATALAALAVGTLSLRIDLGVTRTIVSREVGGYLTRRLLPLTVFAPIALGWLIFMGRRHQLFSMGAADALSTTSIVVVLTSVVLFYGRSHDRVDRKRRESERHLRDSNELTSALARASTVEEVVSITMGLGLTALRASAGAVLRLANNGQTLRVLSAKGYSDQALQRYAIIPIGAEVPTAQAVRAATPVYLGSPEEYAARFPSVPKEYLQKTHRSWAALPLEGRGRLLGAIALSFDEPQVFDAETTERLVQLSRQCAQALDRALLVASEREARERVQAALDAAAIGTYFWDVGTGVVEQDTGVRSIFGLDEDFPVNDIEGYAERIHPEDRPAWQAALDRSRVEGVDFEMRYRVLLPSGDVRWVLDKGRMIRSPFGSGRYLAGAVVDLSSEQRAREQAEAASRAKDEFLAMLGHELRNPLSPIVTSLQLMKLRAPGQLERERAVIERQVNHMIRLVDDLLDVSRITRGKIELRKVPIELQEVVSQALEVTSPLLEARRHELTVDIPEQGLTVTADRERLTQVVANLLTNAAKYTEPGGKVSVRAWRAEDEVLLEVSDNGTGISPDLLPNLFNLFVQGKRTIERSQGGLGLGLSLVKSLVERHGGSVTAESEGVGRGSRFTVRLPASTEPMTPIAPSASASTSPRPKTRSQRILVVDDNRDAAELLAEALTGAGHRVRMAFDGPTALNLASEFQPTLCFLDIGLPVMDGYELARRLRGIPWGHPLTLIALTGYGQPADRERALAAGFDHHLVKPVRLETALGLAARAGEDSVAPPGSSRNVPSGDGARSR